MACNDMNNGLLTELVYKVKQLERDLQSVEAGGDSTLLTSLKERLETLEKCCEDVHNTLETISEEGSLPAGDPDTYLHRNKEDSSLEWVPLDIKDWQEEIDKIHNRISSLHYTALALKLSPAKSFSTSYEKNFTKLPINYMVSWSSNKELSEGKIYIRNTTNIHILKVGANGKIPTSGTVVFDLSNYDSVDPITIEFYGKEKEGKIDEETGELSSGDAKTTSLTISFSTWIKYYPTNEANEPNLAAFENGSFETIQESSSISTVREFTFNTKYCWLLVPVDKIGVSEKFYITANVNNKQSDGWLFRDLESTPDDRGKYLSNEEYLPKLGGYYYVLRNQHPFSSKKTFYIGK